MKTYLNPTPLTLKDMRARLADWGLRDDEPEYWQAWTMFDQTHGAVLPGAGGWLDQDPRIRAFFEFCNVLKAFHMLPEAKPMIGNDW